MTKTIIALGIFTYELGLLIGKAIWTGIVLTYNLVEAFVLTAWNCWKVIFSIVAQTVAWVANNIVMIASRAIALLLIGATWLLVGAQKALNLIMSMNPIALVVIAVAALIAGFLILIATNKKARDAFSLVIESLAFLFGLIWNEGIKATRALGIALISMAETASNVLLNTFINPYIRGLNKIIELTNKVARTSFGTVEEIKVNFSSAKDAFANSTIWENGTIDLFKMTEAIKENIGAFNTENISSKLSALTADFPMLKSLFKTETPTLSEVAPVNATDSIASVTGSNASVTELISQVLGLSKMGQTPAPTNSQAVFNIDGNAFARAIVPLINKENARTGTMAIQGV